MFYSKISYFIIKNKFENLAQHVGNPATTIVSPLLGDTLETTHVLVAVSCVLVERVEDTNS